MGRAGFAGGVAAALICGSCVRASEDVGGAEQPPTGAIEKDEDAVVVITSGDPGLGTTTDGSESSSGALTGIGFITAPDGGSVNIECSLWEQDCPRGEKCTVWAPDGGVVRDGTRCVGVFEHAHPEGDPCHGDWVTGVDTCDVGTFCWDMDPETQLGLCVAFCVGSDSAPTCEDPNKTCNFNKQFAVCLEECDPVLNDCPVGCGCYPVEEGFQCVPDASGDEGAYGDTCEFINACDAGLFCGSAHSVVCDTDGASACCGSFCDVTAPECPPGLECTPWFEGGAPPPHENVGFCKLADMSDPEDSEPGWGTVVP